MFGRSKKKKRTAAEVEQVTEQQEFANAVEESSEPSAADSAGATETAPQMQVVEFDRSSGPWDEEEQDTSEGYMDFGSMRVKMVDGLSMRLDVEQKSQQLVSVTLTKGNNALQVQAFAAPRTTGIWDDIRLEISESVRRQGGQVSVRDGNLGREMISRMPATTPDGRQGFRVARFVGVDGPRWFLRGVYTGDAALRPDDAAEMEEIFRSIVVVRGEDPRPPRDLLPMIVPESIQQAAEQENGQAQTEHHRPQVPQRGPEIAEIR